MVDTISGFPFGDGSSDLANNRLQFIELYHVPTGLAVQFKAFLTVFSDEYTSEWNKEDAFGRMDPIGTFKRTGRVITLGWDVPSAGIEEAVLNFERASMLMSLLYPEYEGLDGGASGIKTAPLFKMRFMNLIQNVANPGLTAKDGGLLGFVDGFVYEPDIEQGFFDSFSLPTEAQAVKFALPNDNVGELIFPQTIKLRCQFTVLHQHALGWNNKVARPGFDRFPYKNPQVQFRAPGKNDKFAPRPDGVTSVEDRRKRESAFRILKGGG